MWVLIGKLGLRGQMEDIIGVTRFADAYFIGAEKKLGSYGQN
jgi:hypothetical protein